MKVEEDDKLIQKWDTELYNKNYSYVYNYGESLLKLLNPKKNERILDLGCGSGQLTFKINKISKKTIGIDKSAEMITNAKLRYGNVKFLICNAENFKFKNKFDSIFSNATLHWIKNYRSVIKCMYENLKLNGKIVLEFGGKNNVKTIIDQLRSSLKKRGYLNQSKLELWYFPSAEEYSKELELAGFKVVLAKSFNRKTELTNQKDGIKDWISMFAKSFFKGVDLIDVEEIKTEVQEGIKEKCFTNGKWYADYKRIRFVAIKNIY
tara:strand:+ start:11721 stop:12512 length:792 start_codon:yes stop_codon:yes gene_type:complete